MLEYRKKHGLLQGMQLDTYLLVDDSPKTQETELAISASPLRRGIVH